MLVLAPLLDYSQTGNRPSVLIPHFRNMAPTPDYMARRRQEVLFGTSSLTEKNPAMSVVEVLAWLTQRGEATTVNVRRLPFRDLKGWCVDDKGNLAHESGRFFTIEGLEVETNWGTTPAWNQPIIDQPEIGILGIITREIDGILHFLLQAKIEPGNISGPQLSPTLQATKSNYTRAHEGHAPLYLEYFTEQLHKSTILIDQLQSEQGARFLRKRNRNMIIRVDEQIPTYDNFCWLTLGQIYRLLTMNNVINMDTRSVISAIPLARFSAQLRAVSMGPAFLNEQQLDFTKALSSEEEGDDDLTHVLSWITSRRSKYYLRTRRIGLTGLTDWTMTEDTIAHNDTSFFSVIAVSVDISNREVPSWHQPLLQPAGNGIIALIANKLGGIYHFLVQAKVEGGHLDVLEIAPTVQCITVDYQTLPEEDWPPFLAYVLGTPPEHVLLDSVQSEEGGRFFKEQTRHLLVLADDCSLTEIPEDYCWVTLAQLKRLVQYNNVLNIEARSLVAVASSMVSALVGG